MTADQVSAVDTLVQSIMKRYGVPGVSLAIAREGEIAYGRGFGHRDVERGLPATLDTVFGIASVSKSFAALCIMQLQDAGRLSVRDPVINYLPEFRMPAVQYTEQVTIHHLLTHTSGLPPMPSRWFVFARSIAAEGRYRETPVPLDSYPPIDTYEQLMALIGRASWRPLGAPGRYLSYSNEGYALLGAIVERVSGQPFARYASTHILEPAGLTRTGFDLDVPDASAPITAFYATETRDGAAVPSPISWWRSPVWHSTGGMCSTVRDLVRYLEIYRTGGMIGDTRIVSRDAVAEMTRSQMEASPGQGYGYGLIVDTDHHGVTVYGHSGERLGASAYVAVAPERGMTAAVLANVGNMPAYSLCLGALRIAMGLPGSDAHAYVDVPYSPRRLSAYAGTYRSAEGSALRVETQDDVLVFEVDGQRYPARPIGKDTFAVREPELEMYARFLVNPGGRPWAVAYGLVIIPRGKIGWKDHARRLPFARSGWRRLRRGAAALRSVVSLLMAERRPGMETLDDGPRTRPS
jgi:CubicO group peptidase (beta-lactamase class C family)